MKILAIIPAFNAEKTIGEVVEGLLSTFDKSDILVVDDGSSDSTYEIAGNKGLRAIKHSKNSGKGAALKTGFRIALDDGYNAVLTLDSDLQHPTMLAENFIQKFERGEADIILGNRMTDLSQMPRSRRFSNTVTSFFVRLWTGKKIPDSQCGYRLISAKILKAADLRLSSYQAETEMILEANRLGARFATISIPTIYNDSVSSIRPFKETAIYIGLMLSHPFRRKRKDI
jgi:glycosyltransferase involved in cell wall biosynthesis